MNISSLPRIIIALGLGCLAGFTARAQITNTNSLQNTNTQLYGISFYDNQLIAINTTNGQGTLAASFPTNLSAYGIATLSNTLYTFNPNLNRIETLNGSNDTVTLSANIGVTNLQGEGDLAFRSDGIGFLSSALNSNDTVANSLYSFNLHGSSNQLNGTNTWIGTTAVALNALAFDSNNVLYALGKDDTNLYTVDQTDAALTVVGPLGVAAASPFAAMTFGSDGTLYAAINDQLYTINKTTGTATAVSTNVLDFGFTSISGLAFGPTTTVAPFFAGAVAVSNGVSFLQFTNSVVFGYYSATNFPYINHQDLGMEYFVDANDGTGAGYFYDFKSAAWLYTSPELYPYIYDFKLNSWLYYFPDTTRPGHYLTNPRVFYNFATSQFITQ